MKSTICKRLWTPKDDMYLVNLINNYGPQKWSFLSSLMCAKFPATPKTSKQCRERWHNNLDPIAVNKPWTASEEAKLLLFYIKYKNDWNFISKNIPQRHNNMVKNHFYSMFRKIKRKIYLRDFSYNSLIELAEAHCIISLMEETNSQHKLINPTRKRGENFLLTLIKDIRKELIEEYKTKLSNLRPLRTSVEEVLERIIQSDEGNEKFSANSTIDIEKWRQITILHAPDFAKEAKMLTSKEKQDFSKLIFNTNSLSISKKPSVELGIKMLVDIPKEIKIPLIFKITGKKDLNTDIESTGKFLKSVNN